MTLDSDGAEAPATSDSGEIPLPEVLHQEMIYSHGDVLDWLAIEPFRTGSHPVAVELTLNGVASAADAAVDGARTQRLLRGPGWERGSVEGDRWSARYKWTANGDVEVVITAEDDDVATATAEAWERVPRGDAGDDTVPVEFVHRAQHGAASHVRRLSAPSWDEIERNYSPGVARAMRSLTDMIRPQASGRLILWHGPPGTGKTTAVRALARSWAQWCRTVYVVDPDSLFNSSEYLVQVVLESPDAGDERPGGGKGRWRLVVVEDADELLRHDAKERSGQALSRLLNLADGMLGQGLDLLILLSTNETFGALHPALTRPGRSMANVGFEPFDRAAATEWLGEPAPPGDSFTLAELYRISGVVSTLTEVDDGLTRPGQYL